MTTRLIGTCPVCEHQQKVTPARTMVHHGYRRPGVGEIIGDCFGVGSKAYELSSEGCSMYRNILAGWRKAKEEWLRTLQSRPPEVLVFSQITRKDKTFRRDSDDSEERHKYESALRSKIQDAEFAIESIDLSDARMVELIEKWEPAPLIEIDEEGFTPQKRTERDARKNERDTKRAEKERKQEALRIQRNERLARRATALFFFLEEFERLAAQPPSKARDDYARDLLFEAAKKKHGIDYPWNLVNGPGDGYGNHTPGPWSFELLDRAGVSLFELGVASPGHLGRPYPIQVFASSGNKILVPEPEGPTDEVLDVISNMKR